MKKSYIFSILIITDIIFTLLSYFLALSLRFDGNIPSLQISYAFNFIGIIILLFMLFSFIFRCYKNTNAFTGYLELIRQFCVVLLTCTVLFLLNVIGLFKVPVSVLIIFGIVTFLLTYLTRVACFFIHKVKNETTFANSKKTSRALIVGLGSSDTTLIKLIKECSNDEIIPIAYVHDAKEKINANNIDIQEIGTSNDISKIVKNQDIDLIIIALPSADCNTIRKIYHKCVFPNVKVKLLLKTNNLVNEQKEMNASMAFRLKDVGIEDMLFFNRIGAASREVKEYISGKTILVTGGAGSIGSELCRQALDNKCKKLIIFDFSENDLFELNEEFKNKYSEERYELVLGSIRDKLCVDEVFRKFKPELVFHAAAHKHVPMIELNPIEAVKNNIIGTMNVIDSCKKYKVAKFILISTDKAVNPTSIMGASKRIAELIVKAENSTVTEMASVRFGNVLGSQGSVVPLFEKQIAAGGPVTITDPEMVRFFMSIPEAVSLVQTAAVTAKGGETFVLDMGSPIKIYDLACDLIRLHGYKPHEDIDIVYTGLRPGEKLFEELSLENETIDITSNSKIFIMRSKEVNQIALYNNINNILKNIKQDQDPEIVRKLVFDTIELKNINIDAEDVVDSINTINY